MCGSSLVLKSLYNLIKTKRANARFLNRNRNRNRTRTMIGDDTAICDTPNLKHLEQTRTLRTSLNMKSKMNPFFFLCIKNFFYCLNVMNLLRELDDALSEDRCFLVGFLVSFFSCRNLAFSSFKASFSLFLRIISSTLLLDDDGVDETTAAGGGVVGV